MSEQSVRPGSGFVLLSGTPTKLKVRGVLVQTAGDMAILMADGSSNAGYVVAVTAGMQFPYQARATVTGNTAVLLGVL